MSADTSVIQTGAVLSTTNLPNAFTQSALPLHCKPGLLHINTTSVCLFTLCPQLPPRLFFFTVLCWAFLLSREHYKSIRSSSTPLFTCFSLPSRFGHVMRRGEESTPMVVMKLKMKGKRPRGRPRLRWLDTIDSHLKRKKTSLKEVLRT